jgi:hypothetical protein
LAGDSNVARPARLGDRLLGLVGGRALPTHPSLFARNETPWPFSVFATISVGPSVSAWRYAASIAARRVRRRQCPPPERLGARRVAVAVHSSIVGPLASRFMSRMPVGFARRGRTFHCLPDGSSASESPISTHAARQFVETHGERHAEADREALPQRSVATSTACPARARERGQVIELLNDRSCPSSIAPIAFSTEKNSGEA